MKVKVFILLCDSGEYATTQHTDIKKVEDLYLNEYFRDIDMKLKNVLKL